MRAAPSPDLSDSHGNFWFINYGRFQENRNKICDIKNIYILGQLRKTGSRPD